MSSGRRYSREKRINLKKVIGCVIIIIALILFVIAISKILNWEDNNLSKKAETSYHLIYQDNKWGVINNSAKIIIEPTYDEMIQIPDANTPLFICTYDVNYEEGTYKTKVLDNENKEILKEYNLVTGIDNFDNEEYWYESGVLKFKRTDKYGLLDYTGKIILEPEYDSITAIQGDKNSLIIKIGSKIGVCNNSGKIIIEPDEYKGFRKVNIENAYIFQKGDKYGIIGADGQILSNEYADIKSFSNSELFVVKEDNKWKVYNKEKEEVISETYDDFAGLGSEYIIVKKSDKYGIINTSGEVKLEIEYTNIRYIEEINSFECKTQEETGIYNKNLEKVATGTILEINVDKTYIKIKENEEDKYYNLAFEPKTDVQEEKELTSIGDWKKVVNDKLVYFEK